MLKLIIKGKQYEVSKIVLKDQMKSTQVNQFDKKNSIQLPTWVQSEEFQPIFSYLNFLDTVKHLDNSKVEERIAEFMSKSISANQSLNNSKKLIHIMRISDYLTLQKFQQHLVQKCVIQTLNSQNCIIYLEQTHKKLKNSSTGTAQAWYTLLNACIDFISYDLSAVYLRQPERIQKLHEKILGEILDRTIKYQLGSCSKSNKPSNQDAREKEIIFNLLMKSKKVNTVDSLCNSLKSSLVNKKINKKMHAKLSWKLHDLYQITDKKVKNFKFLDLNWVLQASRTPQKSLKIKLTLLKPQDQPLKPCPANHIGVFYSKLFWSMEKPLQSSYATSNNSHQPQRPQGQLSQGEQPLQIHYICYKNPAPIDIFMISPDFQRKIEGKKLQLSIYCSIDQCYSFVMNYIVNDYNKIRLDEKKISKEEIYALIEGSKTSGQHSQAVWLIKYLAKNQLQIPIHLLQNLPYDKLPTYQTEFLKKLVRNDNSILDEVFGKKQVSSKALQIQNEINSLSGSKVSDNQDAKSTHSRGVSGGRKKKIFGLSPQKDLQNNFYPQLNKVMENRSDVRSIPVVGQGNRPQPQISLKEKERREIMQIVNMKNYFYDKNSPLLTLM